MIIKDAHGAMVSCQIQDGETVLQAIQRAGIAIWAPCGGNGTCGKCTVLIHDAQGTRTVLACKEKAQEDSTVVLPEANGVMVEGTKGAADQGSAVSESAQLGVAVDIGTTTCVYQLVDLETQEVILSEGEMNPQAAFGADVVSRIAAAADPAAEERLSLLLVDTLESSIKSLCKQAGANSDQVKQVVLVGNTTMEHFACGLDVKPLGVTPFTPQSLFGQEMPLHAPTEGPARTAWLATALAGYVGGDITAGMLAAETADQEQLQLFIDIGTNGEMAFGNKERIVSCAVAAGPAFEGANITFGMPALPGAISSVELGGEGQPVLRIKTVGDAPSIGVCGSGLLDAIACLLDLGLVDESGYLMDEDEAEDELGPEAASITGEVNGANVVFLDREQGIYLGQQDIRMIQLAKGAVRAGIETLLEDRGADYEAVGEVVLAGGFGMHLRPLSACRIGMIPPALLGKIRAAGNTAAQGAVRCLFPEGRAAMERLVERSEYLELSVVPAFNGHYVDGMEFPDAEDFQEEVEAGA